MILWGDEIDGKTTRKVNPIKNQLTRTIKG